MDLFLIDYTKRKLKLQLELAEKLGASHTAFLFSMREAIVIATLGGAGAFIFGLGLIKALAIFSSMFLSCSLVGYLLNYIAILQCQRDAARRDSLLESDAGHT